MRKRSLEWLSIGRSAVAGVPREYRLIGAFDSAAAFLSGAEAIEEQKRRATWARWKGLAAVGREEEEGGFGCGKVGS